MSGPIVAPEGESGESVGPEEPPFSAPEPFQERLVSRVMASVGVRMPTEFLDKTTPEHITRLIEISDESEVREYAHRRWVVGAVLFGLAMVLVFLFALSFVFLVYNAVDSFEKIVTLIIGLVGGGGIGGGVGFGAGRLTSKKPE